MILRFLTIVSLLITYTFEIAFSQCAPRLDGVYKRKLPGEHDLYTYNISSVENNNNFYSVKFDTVFTESWQLEYDLNKNFICQVNRIKNDSFSFFVVNKITSKTNYLCSSRYFDQRGITWTDHFLYYSINGNAGLFNFNDERIKQVMLPSGRILGHDNNFVYYSIFDKIKINKKVYRHGTIFRIDTNAYEIINPQFNKKYYPKENIVFLNEDYRLENTFAYSMEIDCEQKRYFYTTLYYKGVKIDSSLFNDPEMTGERAFLYKDTLKVTKYDLDRFYVNGELIKKTNIRDSIKTHSLLINKYFSYDVIDNYIVAIVEFGRTETHGLKSGVSLTLNGILVKPEHYTYQVVLIFDKNTYQFLEYPQLIFTDE
jgi:hypothetical protein